MFSVFLLCVNAHGWVAAHLAESRKHFHEQNVEKVLVDLLSVPDVSVRTATCKAVHAMSPHIGSNDTFRELGMYKFAQTP